MEERRGKGSTGRPSSKELTAEQMLKNAEAQYARYDQLPVKIRICESEQLLCMVKSRNKSHGKRTER
ncbi:hypothetical protein [Alkalihalobacillus sp. AL-G]|uniref:hypothetical protein n=1 Tax=Alkalihalobacillus sp. AL-G TaxID=2926399 RepID=UPI002729B465|nr:hypothetical protein [Alkalihalobacillus sp. AL-G]WLD92655.1 hypothetical protein MOJ78_16795 [Alkalihalobacillus sp. AL-G]